MSLVGAAGIFTTGLDRATEAAQTKMDSTFKIGGDLTVRRLGFGAMRLTGDGIWGWPPDRANALKVLRRATALGVNLIDTADAYGPEVSELLIAEALRPYPKDLIIATKGGLTRPGPNRWVPNGHPDYLKKCVDGSLKRLGLERIDLYQLHRIDSKVPLEASLGALKEMQSAGKIRHVGLSEVSPAEIEQARKILPIVTVQNQYNIANRRWEKTLNYCEKEGLGFMPWSPLGGGRGFRHEVEMGNLAREFHTEAIPLALAWLLHRSPAMLPIPGTSSVPHLEENVSAAAINLAADDWQRVNALAERV